MISPEQLANLPCDTKRERALAKELKSLDVSERWEYIKSALDADLTSVRPTALILANKVALDRSHLIQLLEIALVRANPSSMASYLEAVIAGLGYRRVINFFNGKVHANPEQVGMALYFLPNLTVPPDDVQRKSISALSSTFKKYVKSLDIKTPYLKACIER